MKKILIFILSFMVFMSISSVANASNAEIDEIQRQIDANRSALSQKSKEVSSLKNQIAVMDGQIRDVELQISKSQAEVKKTQIEIEDLQTQITQKEADLKIQKENLFETMKTMYESGGDRSMVEIIASSNSFTDIIDQSQYLESIRTRIDETVDSIIKIKADLETKKQDQEKKKQEASDLLDQQKNMRQGLAGQKSAKDQLLTQTKGEEAAYQSKLSQAWADYADALSRSSSSGGSNYIGGSGNGYLSSPSSGYLTQGYGCTSFARCGDPHGPYGGNIHNGIDISMGYPGAIKAAADGVVLDKGEEYNSHGWGNWIIIRHPNGLATLYAHLSSFRVSVGQSVSKGDTIGLEGNTGASTGSHLHFSVFTNLTIYNGAYHGPDYGGTVNPYAFL